MVYFGSCRAVAAYSSSRVFCVIRAHLPKDFIIADAKHRRCPMPLPVFLLCLVEASVGAGAGAGAGASTGASVESGAGRGSGTGGGRGVTGRSYMAVFMPEITASIVSSRREGMRYAGTFCMGDWKLYDTGI